MEPTIQMIDVKKRFGKQFVLRGVNLSIYDGKTTVIVGESGTGKSSIIKHILGLVKPDSGEILVNGKDINKIKNKELKEIRSQFGVLFQNAALFDSMTVFDNVAFGLRCKKGTKKLMEEMVNEILKSVKVEKFKKAFADRLETPK